MLIVVAFALLVIGNALLFVKARKLRWVWPVAALFVGSAIAFAVHARATNREVKRLDESLADSCHYLASELRSIVFDYQTVMLAGEKDTYSPVTSLRIRGQYARIKDPDVYGNWVGMCVPNATSCLPNDLNERTVDQLERAAAAIGERKHCP